MHSKLQKLLSLIPVDTDEIYLGIAEDKASEVELCERVAARKYVNYFQAISQCHSILTGWMHCSPIMLDFCAGSLINTPFISGNAEWH